MREFSVGFLLAAVLFIGTAFAWIAHFVVKDQESFRRLLGEIDGL